MNSLIRAIQMFGLESLAGGSHKGRKNQQGKQERGANYLSQHHQ